MTLRARTALALAAVMLGPLLAALVVVVVLMPRDTQSAPGPTGSDLDGWVLAAALVLLGGAVTFLAILAVRLARPFAALAAITDTARRLGAGELDARSGVSGDDEVGRVGAVLDAVADRLATTQSELERRGELLNETFERFGEALAGTHDIDALLRSVVEAARRGSDAAVGTVLLGDAGALSERVSAVPDGARGRWVAEVLDRLTTLAARAVRSGQTCSADLSPVAGGALAVPIRRGNAVVGVLALARPRGAPLMDGVAAAAVHALAAHAGTAVANVREHHDAQRLSVTDPLTGAGNVRHLTATLNREVERAHRFGRTLSVLMLDLDHFKQVNDVAGHDFGDAVLEEFAARLQGCVREVDLVARRGGEEFAIVLPETPADGALAVARRVLDRVGAQPFSHAGISRPVTTSIGVASYPEHAGSAGGVMHAADIALYRAKREGRDRWCLADPLPEATAGSGLPDVTAGSGPPDVTAGPRLTVAP